MTKIKINFSSRLSEGWILTGNKGIKPEQIFANKRYKNELRKCDYYSKGASLVAQG